MAKEELALPDLWRTFRLVAGGVLLAGLVVGWLVPPALSNDSAVGWQVWLSMQAGAPFNCQWFPSAADVAHDEAVFQAWWSPGQYLVPALFTSAGLSIGHAIVLVGMLANAAGLAGWWRLWRAWRVPPRVLVAAGLVVVCGRAFGAILGVSNLSDVLLFASVPWVALLAWHWRRLQVLPWLGLFVVFNVAMGLKLAFAVAAIAILSGVVAEAARPESGLRPLAWLGLAGRALGLWLAVKWLWDWGYLSRGSSIASHHGPEFSSWAAVFLPWGGPLLSAFSGMNLLGRIFLYPGHALLADERALWPCFLLAAGLAAWLIARLGRVSEARTYAIQAVVWLGFYGLAFTWLYATGAAVSLEERHFQPAGLVLLPGVLWVLGSMTSRAGRWLMGVIIAGFCLYGLGSVISHARFRMIHGVPSTLGFTHIELTRGALAELRRLDAAPGQRTLFFVTNPEIALEVRHGRAVCVPLDTWNEAFVRQITYEGRAGLVVLAVPQRHYRNGRMRWVEAGLHGYRDWTEHEVDGFFFITGR